MLTVDITPALFEAGLPLFLLAFALVSWSLHKGWLAGESVKELQSSIDALGKSRKNKKQRQSIDPALGKWFRFGGGFYGLVALYTWILIEWDDVADFLSGLSAIVFEMDPGALIGLVIKLFVESLVNFVLAIAWPAYWLSESRHALVTLVIAYGGYWLGIKAAQYAWRQGWVSRAIDHASTLLRRWF